MEKENLAVIFGARSSEHDVSIVSTFQILPWLSKKYRPFFIYLDRQNQAYLCPRPQGNNFHSFIQRTLKRNRKVEFIPGGIRIKAFFSRQINLAAALLIMHGAYGEDGRIQGMLDFYGIPYTGSGVLGSALGMDKVISKVVFSQMGLPVAPYFWFGDYQWRKEPQNIIKTIEKKLKYPLFVKPANAGSSVGISRVEKRRFLGKAIRQAAAYDHKILVEEGIPDAVDINCAVMGGNDPQVSVCEQPIFDDQFLSFEEKYLKGGKNKGMAGLSRIVPAPIPASVSKKIQVMAKDIFRHLNCWGMARIDFLYQPKKKKIYPNEVNTIPGSLAFYLWEASGIKPARLIEKMIALAKQRKKSLDRLSYSFASPLLDQK